jgi:hypothetical protein
MVQIFNDSISETGFLSFIRYQDSTVNPEKDIIIRRGEKPLRIGLSS